MSKETFVQLYKENITRPGADKLLEYLEKSDFFTAPASTRYHGAHQGGLCEHSINVYYRLLKEDPDISPETAAICALLHDICKVGFYTVSMRNVKNEQTGQWEKQPYYTVDDKLPYGHGEKSVFMVERYMRLTVEEAVAIRWHMGFSDNDFRGGGQSVGAAFEKYPLALYLHIADLKATYLDENKNSSGS